MGATNCIVCAMSLDTKTSVLLTSRCESSSLTVLVYGVNDPVDARIVSDANVVRINENYFKVFVCCILVNPIGVEHAQVHASTTSALFGNTAKVTREFELVDTSILWLSINNSLWVGSLSATTTNGNTVNNITLLSLVANLVCLVRTSRPLQASNLLALAVLPRPVWF